MVESLWRPIELPGFKFGSIGSSSFAIGRSNDAGASSDMEEVEPFEFVDNQKTLDAWEMNFSKSPVSLQGITELKEIIANCQAAGFGSKRIRVDSSVVRGLEYYTGPVYEMELTFEAINGGGRPVRFGSVGGGGRYDGLVSRFRGEPVPATGSLSASRACRRPSRCSANSTPSRHPDRCWSPCSTASASPTIRKWCRRCACRHPRRTLPWQSQAQRWPAAQNADRRSSPCAVIQGSDEKPKASCRSRTSSSVLNWPSWKKAAKNT